MKELAHDIQIIPLEKQQVYKHGISNNGSVVQSTC